MKPTDIRRIAGVAEALVGTVGPTERGLAVSFGGCRLGPDVIFDSVLDTASRIEFVPRAGRIEVRFESKSQTSTSCLADELERVALVLREASF